MYFSGQSWCFFHLQDLALMRQTQKIPLCCRLGRKSHYQSSGFSHSILRKKKWWSWAGDNHFVLPISLFHWTRAFWLVTILTVPICGAFGVLFQWSITLNCNFSNYCWTLHIGIFDNSHYFWKLWPFLLYWIKSRFPFLPPDSRVQNRGNRLKS